MTYTQREEREKSNNEDEAIMAVAVPPYTLTASYS